MNELRLPDSDTEAPAIQPRAYLHRTADTCVSTDPTTYAKPRVLVAWHDVLDHVDWVDRGIAEWRTYAVEIGAQLAKLRAHQKDQLAALVAAEAFACRVRHWEEGKPDLHDIKVMLRDTIAKGSLEMPYPMAYTLYRAPGFYAWFYNCRAPVAPT